MEEFFGIFLTFGLMGAGYFVGRSRERRHLEHLHVRETELAGILAVPLATIAGAERSTQSALVEGSVVVSIDYFKRMIAGIIGVFGGRIDLYQTVLSRARREAVLRLKESARQQGMNAVICMRIETSRLASGRRDGKGTAGVELLAFGTAIRLIEEPSVASP